MASKKYKKPSSKKPSYGAYPFQSQNEYKDYMAIAPKYQQQFQDWRGGDPGKRNYIQWKALYGGKASMYPHLASPGGGQAGGAPGQPPGGATPRAPSDAPLSFQEQAARDTAYSRYQQARGGIGSNLYLAALNYGAPGAIDQVNSVGLGQLGPAVENPNSALATIQRALTDQTKGLQQSNNAQNTFFSGGHLDQQQRAQDDAGRQRAAAQMEFEAALQDLLSQLATAETDYNQVNFDTRGSAIDRYMSEPPEPLAETPPSPSRLPGSGGGGAGVSEAKYLHGLRAIRERYGANSPEVQRYRKRHGR